jgi:large conductance mechanosensitive channel
MLKEFRDFAMKGNVVDLAVAVIIGAAFGAIVTSLVSDIIMPIIGAVGSIDFSNYFVPLTSKVTASNLDDARKQGAVLAYGRFITLVVNFLIVAFSLFLVIRIMTKLKRHEEAEAKAAEPPKPSAEVVLLTEIRDLLKKA